MSKTNKDILTDRVQELIDYSFAGKRSPIFISGTSAVAINQGHTIQFPEATVIAAITYNAHGSSASLVAETMPAGFTLYLNNITSLTLTSGSAFVHEK